MKHLRCRTVGILGRIFLSIAGLSVAIAAQATEKDIAIAIGQRFQIESKVLHETRRFFVHTPYKYRLRSDRFPVLVVLDGAAHFAHASAAVDHLAASGRIPEMIVVGVPNTYRWRDLAMPGASNQGSVLGAADRFLDFLADELLPQIDRTYRTRPYRALVGHSLGGTFAVYALQNRPEVFNAFIAMSPALQINDESLVKNMAPFLDSHASLQTDLYVTRGDEPFLEPAISKFINVLTTKAPAGFRVKSTLQKNEGHTSIPYPGVHEGLQQIFDGWTLADPVAIYDQSGFAGLEAHFAKVSGRLGYSVPIQENVLEKLFGQFLQRGRFKDAEALISDLADRYPDNARVHEAGVLLYSMMKDNSRVIEHARRILTLSPGNADALKILEQNKEDIPHPISEFNPLPDTLNHFAGSYASEDEFIDVSMKNGKLYCATDAGEFELRPASASSFYLADANIKLTFIKGEKNKVASVALDRLGGILYSTETLKRL